MKEEHFRNHIYWLTFFFSLLVIWVHSYNAELYLGQTPQMEVIYRLEHKIGDRLGQMAVPGFFMISAYLFYRNFTWAKLGIKWKSRMQSILVPYLVWNTIYYLGYVIASRLPWVNHVVGKGVIPLTLNVAVDAILFHRYNYIFWYLFQLLQLILLAPVLYYLLRRIKFGFVFLTLVYLGIWAMIKLPYLNLDALFYYSLAAYLAIHRQRWVEAIWTRKRAAAGMLCLLTSFLLFELSGRLALVGPLVTSRCFFPAGVWLLMPSEKLPKAKEFMKCNFFLYATHFAFVRFINKAGAKLLPPLMWFPFVLYLLMPFLVLIINSMMAYVLLNYLPRLWHLLNGGRTG